MNSLLIHHAVLRRRGDTSGDQYRGAARISVGVQTPALARRPQLPRHVPTERGALNLNLNTWTRG